MYGIEAHTTLVGRCVVRGILRHSAFSGALLLLAGCGGGGLGILGGGGGGGTNVSDIPWPVDPVAVQSLTSGTPSTVTGADVGRNLDRVAGAANSLLVSDLLVFTTNGPPRRGETSCSGDRCASGFLGSSLNLLLSDELGIRGPSEYQAVAEHRGVLLAQGRGKGDVAGTAADYAGYGGWLDHSFFVVEFNRIADGVLENTPFNYGYSIGDAPETNPVAAGGSGTWSGVMVGADVSETAARGDRIQGEATLTIAGLRGARRRRRLHQHPQPRRPQHRRRHDLDRHRRDRRAHSRARRARSRADSTARATRRSAGSSSATRSSARSARPASSVPGPDRPGASPFTSCPRIESGLVPVIRVFAGRSVLPSSGLQSRPLRPLKDLRRPDRHSPRTGLEPLAGPFSWPGLPAVPSSSPPSPAPAVAVHACSSVSRAIRGLRDVGTGRPAGAPSGR